MKREPGGTRVCGIVLELDLPPEIVEDLESLMVLARGRYGRSREEVAERLIAQRLLEISEEGWLLTRALP